MRSDTERAQRQRYKKRRMQRDPEFRRQVRRRESLRYNHHITPSDYDLLLLVQHGVCAICGMPPGKQVLSVDHDHKTKFIRGLLCQDCNLGLGRFKDRPDLLASAINYLQRGLRA